MEPIELKNALVKHKISILRDKKTGTKEFRELIEEITMFLCYEALKDTQTEKVIVETPVANANGYKINENNFVFLPILRAGLGMANGIMKAMPNAKFGHIGMARNEETLEPEEYYFKVPNGIEEKEVMVLDPMLATGGSGADAIRRMKERGVKKIKFLCIIAAPEGLEKIQKEHPDVQIYCAQIDEKLNERGYIVPGLGDAGDRIFGTK